MPDLNMPLMKFQIVYFCPYEKSSQGGAKGADPISVPALDKVGFSAHSPLNEKICPRL